jgi:NAD-dependent dihydropyrimidine dehydrogenase PreA subunit
MIQIIWDSNKCPTPRECRKCIEACPQGVFSTYPRDGRSRGQLTENWALAPLFLSLCTGCEICEETCPQKAITLTANQG